MIVPELIVTVTPEVNVVVPTVMSVPLVPTVRPETMVLPALSRNSASAAVPEFEIVAEGVPFRVMTPEATEKLGFCSVMVASTPVEPDKAEVPITSSPSLDPASIRLAPAVSRAGRVTVPPGAGSSIATRPTGVGACPAFLLRQACIQPAAAAPACGLGHCRLGQNPHSRGLIIPTPSLCHPLTAPRLTHPLSFEKDKKDGAGRGNWGKETEATECVSATPLYDM